MPNRELSELWDTNSKKHFYSFGYTSYEESYITQLTSSKEYSSKEFEKIVHRATLNVFNSILNDKKCPKRYDENTWKYLVKYHCIRKCLCKTAYDKKTCKGINGISFQDIVNLVKEELVFVFGFSELEYNASWVCFGWPSILDMKDWSNPKNLKETQRDPQLNKLSSFMKRGLRNNKSKRNGTNKHG
jgi:hypothetical protein